MLRNLLFVLFCFSIAGAGAACSSSAPTSNANTVNATNIDAKNMPPEFAANAVTVNGSVPGIPNQNDANANKVNLSNVPGIPDPNKKTPEPKNTPKIEGIPSEAEIKRQMNTPLKDVNVVNNPPANQRPTADDQPANKRGNTRQP